MVKHKIQSVWRPKRNMKWHHNASTNQLTCIRCAIKSVVCMCGHKLIKSIWTLVQKMKWWQINLLIYANVTIEKKKKNWKWKYKWTPGGGIKYKYQCRAELKKKKKKNRVCMCVTICIGCCCWYCCVCGCGSRQNPVLPHFLSFPFNLL